MKDLKNSQLSTVHSPLKPGYKQTEVGVIPEDWNVCELNSFAKVTSGKRLPLGRSLTENPTPHPYIRVKDMTQGSIIQSDLMYVPEDTFPQIKRYCIFKDDLFISVAGSLGIVGSVPENLDGANLTENANRIWDIKESQGYLLHVLLSPLIQNIIQSIQTIGAQPKLALGRIRDFKIPLPPTKAEQAAIAEALSDADVLIESLEQLIAKKCQIKQGAMQALLTAPPLQMENGKWIMDNDQSKESAPNSQFSTIHSPLSRLPGFSGDWEVKTLGEFVTFLKTGTFSRAQLDTDGTIRYLHYGDIHTSRNIILKPDQELMPYLPGPLAKLLDRLQDGDLIFADASEDREGVGKSVELSNVGTKTLVSGLHTIAARFDKAVLADGYKAYLQFIPDFTSQLGRLAAGTKVYATTRSHIASIELMLPPISEQTAIAEILRDMDEEIATLETKLTKARQIKQGMMQELLTGRIRLV